jgi:hypothetical protein
MVQEIRKIVETEKRIDALANNTCYGYFGAQ